MDVQHFLTGEELSAHQLHELLGSAEQLKSERSGNDRPAPLAGKSVLLLFELPSTRTRISFEVGIGELGGTALVLREGELQLARGESIRDTALVLSRYVSAVVVRTGPHELVEQLAQSSDVPVVNALTESHHPCQALADMLTLRQRFGELKGLKLAYVGDGNNVAHSLLLIAPALGVDLSVATPPQFSPDDAVVERALAQAKGSILLTHEPEEAARGAQAIYTDVWVSMGDEKEIERRRRAFAEFQLNETLFSGADKEAVAMHCLPAHPGEEITEDLLYGSRSVVWDQAENRLHVQKALLSQLIG